MFLTSMLFLIKFNEVFSNKEGDCVIWPIWIRFRIDRFIDDKIVLALCMNFLHNLFPGWSDLATFCCLGYFFKGPAQFLRENMVCFRHFKSSEGIYSRCFWLSNWVLMKIFCIFLVCQLFWLLFQKFGHFYQSSGGPACFKPNLISVFFISTKYTHIRLGLKYLAEPNTL